MRIVESFDPYNAIPKEGMLDTLSRSFGLETENGDTLIFLKKDMPLPARSKGLFTTLYDNQTNVEIHVLQGEEKKAAKNISLGHFFLQSIPAMPQGLAKIELEFQADIDEILTIHASERLSGVKTSFVLVGEQEPKAMYSLRRMRFLQQRLQNSFSTASSLEGEFQKEILESLAEASRLIPLYERGDIVAATVRDSCFTMELLLAELLSRGRLKS